MKILMTAILFFSSSVSAVSTVQFASKAGQHPFTCSGNFGQSGLVEKVGFSEAELRKGIPCEIADFDGNGSSDFWFWKCDKKGLCSMLSVLMNKNDVLKSVVVPAGEMLEVYTKQLYPGRRTLPGVGRKFPAVDVLVKRGKKEDETHIIYKLKPDASGFEKHSECF